jgi:hypothetical protein
VLKLAIIIALEAKLEAADQNVIVKHYPLSHLSSFSSL